MEKVFTAMQNDILKLVPFEKKHLKLVLSLYKEKESLIHIAPFKDQPDSFFEAFLNKALTRKGSIQIIYSNKNVFLGIVSFNKMNDFFHLGIHLKIEHQKKGYAKEALILLINQLKSQDIYEVVYALIEKQNISSVKLFEKLGFVEESTISISDIEVSKFQLFLK